MEENKGEETKGKQQPEKVEPPTAEQVAEALKAGDGSLSSAMEQALQAGVLLGADVMGAFKMALADDVVGRKDPCPCGSGTEFMYCCRSVWRLVESAQRKLRREAETGKKETPEELMARMREETDWMVMVGTHPATGAISFDFPEGADKLPLSVLVELLFKAWMEAFLRLSSVQARQTVMDAMISVAQQQRPRRSGGMRRR